MKPYTCQICKKIVSKKNNGKFCSIICLKKYQETTWVKIPCSSCGTINLVRKVNRRNYKNAFCNKQCEANYRSYNNQIDSVKWLGEWRKCGYVYHKINGKYRGEHRLVMERFLGRNLSKKELVHHLNGIRDDNRLENLCVVDSSSHEINTFIKQLQKRIIQLELKNGIQ